MNVYTATYGYVDILTPLYTDFSTDEYAVELVLEEDKYVTTAGIMYTEIHVHDEMR